jgi:hypothetical protein
LREHGRNSITRHIGSPCGRTVPRNFGNPASASGVIMNRDSRMCFTVGGCCSAQLLRPGSHHIMCVYIHLPGFLAYRQEGSSVAAPRGTKKGGVRVATVQDERALWKAAASGASRGREQLTALSISLLSAARRAVDPGGMHGSERREGRAEVGVEAGGISSPIWGELALVPH